MERSLRQMFLMVILAAVTLSLSIPGVSVQPARRAKGIAVAVSARVPASEERRGLAASTLWSRATPPLNSRRLFLNPNNSAVGAYPVSVAVADFNGDGRADLVVVNSNCIGGTCTNPGSVSILLGNGGGTFQSHVDYTVGIDPLSVAVGDFNGDGHPDLAVANFQSNTVSVLLGNGDGTFQPHADYATAAFPNTVAVGDFNRDGKMDLVTANFGNNTTSGVSVLLGNGSGGFGAHADYATTSTGPTGVAVGDFNGDGKLDLATSEGTLISVLIGNGDGTFQKHKDFSALANAQIVTGDVNGDGKADLVTVGFGAVYVYLGKGDGTFTRSTPNRTGGAQGALAIADLNGDGRLDLVTANGFANGISVLLGNGDGTFQPHVDYGTGSGPLAVAVGDFRGDGKADVVTANHDDNTASAIIGNGDGTLQTHRYLIVDAVGTGGVATGDFNGDGKVDLVATDEGNGADSAMLAILIGNGDGTFQPVVHYPAGYQPPAVVVADFNGDGKADLAVADIACAVSPCDPGYITVLLGDGDGTFHIVYQTFGVGIYPFSLVAGDFNGDGKTDLAVTNLQDGTVSVLLGKGDGTFQAQVAYATGTAKGLGVGDFNGDGKLDLAVGTDTAVAILLGNGDGTFQAPVQYPVADGASGLAVGDFNRDGKLDLAVTGTSNTVSTLLGNGDGSFQAPVNYSTSSIARSIIVADLHGNGIADLATENVSNSISVLLGNGQGGFSAPADFLAGVEPVSIAAGDFNGDGRLDLTTADLAGATVSVWLNTSGTRVKITSAPNPSKVHQAVIFTATVKATVEGAGTPTGTVTFMTGPHVLGTATMVNGVATLTNATLPIGSHQITAQYSGDSTFSPNTSGAIIQKVTP